MLTAILALSLLQNPAPSATIAERIQRYSLDSGALQRAYGVRGSPRGEERMARFLDEQRAALRGIELATLSQEEQLDLVQFEQLLERESLRRARELSRAEEVRTWLPFRAALIELCEDRDRKPAQAAGELDRLRREIATAREQTRQNKPRASLAARASELVEALRSDLEEWKGWRASYDPEFDWWCAEPLSAVLKELGEYRRELKEDIAGLKGGDDEPVVGDPILRDALIEELQAAAIAYTPEELLEIAEREYAWCLERMLDASRRMGCGDDWKAALEKVKQDHVEPGEQPGLILELAREAEEYLETNQLVTIPPLAKEVWRMEMMSKERQLVSPFFTGGEVISISFPTADMTYEQKLMSLRGNNRHFARATVHHELIPGHHLEAFQTQRHFPHRRVFATPFYWEGWALWWELFLWERGFQKTPENEVGMLFWRMHRCVRIQFSLSFHLGKLTPAECVDLLVDKVGHERRNAQAEVRRSFNGSYGPLYQIAYLVGGLQFRELYRELVSETKQYSVREFHDTILSGGSMPIEFVRFRLKRQTPPRDFKPAWRFYPLR